MPSRGPCHQQRVAELQCDVLESLAQVFALSVNRKNQDTVTLPEVQVSQGPADQRGARSDDAFHQYSLARLYLAKTECGFHGELDTPSLSEFLHASDDGLEQEPVAFLKPEFVQSRGHSAAFANDVNDPDLAHPGEWSLRDCFADKRRIRRNYRLGEELSSFPGGKQSGQGFAPGKQFPADGRHVSESNRSVNDTELCDLKDSDRFHAPLASDSIDEQVRRTAQEGAGSADD
jgi:hypothetical protein